MLLPYVHVHHTSDILAPEACEEFLAISLLGPRYQTQRLYIDSNELRMCCFNLRLETNIETHALAKVQGRPLQRGTLVSDPAYPVEAKLKPTLWTNDSPSKRGIPDSPAVYQTLFRRSAY